MKLLSNIYPLDNCNNLLRQRIYNKHEVLYIKKLVLRFPNKRDVNMFALLALDKIQIKYNINDVYRPSCYKKYKNEEYD